MYVLIIGTVSTVFFNLAIHHFISPAHGFNRGQINKNVCIDYWHSFNRVFNLAIHHFISPAHGFNRGQINKNVCIDYWHGFNRVFKSCHPSFHLTTSPRF
jgi:hypothetical protein